MLATISLLGGTANAERVIIKCQRPCTDVIATVEAGGGTVTHRYRYVDAVAADVPPDALTAVRAVVAPGSVRKDFLVSLPDPARDRDGSRLLASEDAVSAVAMNEAALMSMANESPDAYRINNAETRVTTLHGQGLYGQGLKVAVIDSGIRPGFPHLSLDGSVIGGEDFVGDGLTWSNFANGGHGTFVAGMISANVTFSFSTTSPFLVAVKRYCQACVTGASQNQVPMLGSAPLSSIYALRVFGPTGGAPESTVIAAMERVIQLRENFDNGMPETRRSDGSYVALNIKVCNMSLGGATLYAGRDLEDEVTQAFLEHDIVLVTSAGNAGPSGTTGGSPGTGFGSLTVGASSSAVHERILRDLGYGPGIGARYRPFADTQMSYFSSRGPTADGRVDPELVANGFASYGQGFAATVNSISLASGTSFSTPTVAGIAAVLRQAVPDATARQVRNALIMSADQSVLKDRSGALDMGNGYVNAVAARDLLQDMVAPDTPGTEGGVSTDVKVNIGQGTGLQVFQGNTTRRAASLLPGQRFDTYYRVLPNTKAIVVRLFGVTPGAVQNEFFGDDILLSVHSAKTSAIGEGDYPVFAFSTGGTWAIENPEEGLMRVTMSGDWTNASAIGASVNIYAIADPVSQLTADQKIADGETLVYRVAVPAGTKQLTARASWTGTWDSYPTNDMDIILVDPNGGAYFEGATINSPEYVEVADPMSGDWYVLISGYTVSTKNGDRVKVRVALDGRVVR